MTNKQRAHWNLDALIHNCVRNKKSYKATVDLPAYELMQELGFASPDVGALEIVITAKFIDEEEEMYDRETSTPDQD